MSTADDPEAPARKPPDGDQPAPRAHPGESDASAWDRQWERDVAEGRPDALADEAIRDFRSGRSPDL